MVNSKSVITALIGAAIIKIISMVSVATNEILPHSKTPDFWEKIHIKKTEDFNLITEIYYTKTFIDTMNNLSDTDKIEIKSKIDNLVNPSPSIIPYTALYNETTQTPKNKIATIVNKMRFDTHFGMDIPAKGKIRRTRHTDTTFKFAYIMAPDISKEVLVNKIRNNEDIIIKMFIVGYGNHKYFGN